MDDEEIQEENQFEELIQGLIDDKYGCCNDFILPSTASGLRANMQSLSESGNMNPSGIGNNLDLKKTKTLEEIGLIGLENKVQTNLN